MAYWHLGKKSIVEAAFNRVFAQLPEHCSNVEVGEHHFLCDAGNLKWAIFFLLVSPTPPCASLFIYIFRALRTQLQRSVILIITVLQKCTHKIQDPWPAARLKFYKTENVYWILLHLPLQIPLHLP